MSSDSYNGSVNELKSIERGILNDLMDLKSKIDQSVNTFAIENSIKKSLEKYNSMYLKLSEEYTKKTSGYISLLPEKEYSRRINEIQELRNGYDRLKGNYDGMIDTKYKYKGNTNTLSEAYTEDETQKKMTNQQLYEQQQKKLKDQDEMIDNMIGMTKKGKNMGIELKESLTAQNKELDNVDTDMEKLDNGMKRTQSKFEDYIEKSSNFCLLVVIGVELLGLMLIILFM